TALARRLQLCVLGWGLLAGANAAAQVLTLEEIETKAQRDRSELVERQASIEKAQAELALAQSRSGPTIGARVDGSLAPGGELIPLEKDGNEYLVSGASKLGQSDSFLPRARYAAMLSGKMTLLDFGRTSAGVSAAQAALGAERASLLQAKVELVRGARSAYLEWLDAHQIWQLAQRDAEVTRARTASVRELIAAGARPATDAALSSYDEQLAGLRQSRAQRAAIAALRTLGASVQSTLSESAEPDLRVLETGVEPSAAAAPAAGAAGPAAAPAAAASATESDSALSALALQRQAALSAARAADRGVAPVLDAAAELGVQGQDAQIFPAYKAGITLTFPIWDGGARSAQAAVHRAEARGLDARRQATERQLNAERVAARERFQAAAEDLRLSTELLTTAELVLSQAEEHYRSGSDTLERVLNAQRSLVQARREVLSSQLETARARLELTPIRVQP
ncbi:MAG TPA: TolC family protein, partial [Polyangiaceae bacterium]|nr:TolC family protein [Polyangiaceae bacterium]